MAWVVLFGLALPAGANPVVAVAAVTYPLFLWGLLPIIAVEAWVLRIILKDSWPRVLTASGLANVCSTFLGLPLSWFAQHYLQVATIGFEPSLADGSYKPPPKLLDYLLGAGYAYGGDYWDIQIKAVVCLSVAYLTAVLVEYGIYKLALKGTAPESLRRSAWLANAATYAPIFLLLWSLLAYQALTGSPAEAYYRWLEDLARATPGR